MLGVSGCLVPIVPDIGIGPGGQELQSLGHLNTQRESDDERFIG